MCKTQAKPHLVLLIHVTRCFHSVVYGVYLLVFKNRQYNVFSLFVVRRELQRNHRRLQSARFPLRWIHLANRFQTCARRIRPQVPVYRPRTFPRKVRMP